MTDRTAYASIRNLCGVSLKSVTLEHQYSDDSIESRTWHNVPSATVSPLSERLPVHYETGFIHAGQDYWRITYTLPDDSVWGPSDWIKDTLQSENDGENIYLDIQGTNFSGWSGGSTQLSKVGDSDYNAWAVITMRNDFPVDAKVTLTHHYEGKSATSKTWNLIPNGATAGGDDAYIAYYHTGFISTGTDYWKVTLQLDIPPYDNQLSEAFGVFSNDDENKTCMLRAEDNGKIQPFSINGKEFTMGMGSGSCTDKWKTWNDYNTLAFIRVQNRFDKAISTLTMTHQYSSDTVYEQTRGLIHQDAYSGLMVVEYLTGITHPGLDWWTMYVYLEDGTWYKNHKQPKECLLRDSDAVSLLTFSVSADSFEINLPSGSCSDSMDFQGSYFQSCGRDYSKPYNQNAYVGSHNAYANFAEGYWYAQQSSSLRTQLALGATTLLLDLWYYREDIYLLHEDITALQPFSTPQKLSTALEIVKSYVQMQPNEVVTLVFEDRVDSEYQSLIKQAFIDSGTWDMAFNPDTYNVNHNGWPSLDELHAMGKPIVVFTSRNHSADFAYQWNYMSENVYGDDSLDQSTWLNKRHESQPLNELGLCALNHFPTWSTSSFLLTEWLARAERDNADTLLKSMIDACKSTWGRYPNWINADFWEIPDAGVINAVVYMNQKLRGGSFTSMKVQHGRMIPEQQNDQRLLQADWKAQAHWLEQNWEEICPVLTPHSDTMQPQDLFQLEHLVNLSMVISTLCSSSERSDQVVKAWTERIFSRLTDYLHSIQEPLLNLLKKDQGLVALPYCIPFFLIEQQQDTRFTLTQWVKTLVRHNQIPVNSLDLLLLSSLAGHSKSLDELGLRLRKRLLALDEHPGLKTQQGYGFTHELLYSSLFGREVTKSKALSDHLEHLTAEFMPNNYDLGAEMLACYWLSGGKSTPVIQKAIALLQTHAQEDEAVCAKKTGKNCSCAAMKEIFHHKLTTLLGLGMTLNIAARQTSHEQAESELLAKV